VPVPVSILLPVFFRHPDAPPLAGDSVIKRDSSAASSTAPSVSANKVTADTPKVTVAKPVAKKPVAKPAKRRTSR